MRALSLAAAAVCLTAAGALPARGATAGHVVSDKKAAALAAAREASLEALPSYVPLVFQQPYLDSVYSPPGSGPWQYYVYFTYTTQPNTGFQVRVSCLTDNKDVDVVVGDWTNPIPTIQTANYTSATDYIEIIEVWPQAVQCGAAPTGCIYYIGVAGYTYGQHSFTIEITSNNGITTLSDGVPQDGIVGLGAMEYFSFLPFTPSSSTGSLTVSVESMYGDPDVYVTLNNPNAPGPQNFAYALAGFAGPNLLTISFRDPNFYNVCPVAGNQACNVGIGISGWSASRFIITMSTNTAIVNLTDGFAVSRTVAGNAYAYFAYVPPTTGNITIACTVSSGDADMYVSTSTAYPTQSVWTWSQATAGDEVIIIPTSDPNYAAPPAVYYIGIFGYDNVNSTFTLLAVTNSGSGPGSGVIMLADGVPQAGEAAPHSMALFSFNTTNAYAPGFGVRGVDIFAVPQQGDVNVYVSNKTDASGNTIYPAPLCLYKSSTTGACLFWGADPATYTWSSTNTAVQDLVAIPPSVLTPGQQLGIGVLATTPDGPTGPPQPSIFSVTASTGNTVITLQQGTPVPGVVFAGQMKYYRLVLSIYGADVFVSADVAAGSLDLYAAEGTVYPRPVPGQSTYNTTGSGGILKDRMLAIPFASLTSSCRIALMFGTSSCEIYITVVGYVNMGLGVEAPYTLSASATNSPLAPTLLTDGQTQYTFVPAYGCAYLYAMAAAPPGGSIYIVVNNLIGSTQLYLNLQNNTANKGFWTPTGGVPSDWVSVDAGGYERIIMSPPKTASPEPTADMVIPLSRDATTGLVVVDKASAAYKEGGATVVQHLPDGRAVLEVRLPGPAGETVTVQDKGGKTTAVHATSPLAQRMGAGAFAHTAYAASKGKLPLPTYVPRAATAPSVRADPTPTPPYCNNCELYITVASVGGVDAYALVDFHTGDRVEQLVQDEALYGFVTPATGSGAYYSWAQTDPLADVTFTFSRIFGSEDVYISVQQPSAPWVLPGPSSYTWTFSTSAFTPSITIKKSDPLACAPADGSAPGAPCVYLLSVWPRYNETAAYSIQASNSPGITNLQDGQPVTGSVTEASPAAAATPSYYFFQPTSAGYPAPDVMISWTNLLGTVQAYVTNQFVPGVSGPTALPGPASTSCQWICTNYSGCWVGRNSSSCYTPNAPGGGPVVYTIAIVGATGIPAFTSYYSVTAAIYGDPMRLDIGVPTTDIFIFGRSNVVFAFDLPDANSDVIISASVNTGDVVMMVAHDDPTNFNMPGCNPPHSGAQLICGNYTWMATGVGESVIYLPATNPCNPLLPPGTMGINVGKGSACDPNGPNYNPFSAFHAGRFWIVLYGMTDFAELSLTVNVVRGAAAPYLLADGQPQDTQSGPITVCPGGTRDPYSFACNDTTVPSFAVQGSLFLFRMPSGIPVGDMFVQVEKLCGGNTTGECGPDLFLAAGGCPQGSCNPANLVPYTGNSSAVNYVMREALGGMWIPWDACYGPGGSGAAACQYAVGVYPMSGPDPTRPGFQGAPALYRVTLTTSVGIQRISADCLSYGKVCTLPEHSVASGGFRRYEVYSGSMANPVPVTVTATLCSGDPTPGVPGSFAVYACTDGGKCGAPNSPAPGSNDAFAMGNTKGVASMTVTGGTDVMFLAVQASGKSGLPFPSFQLAVQGGPGPVLMLDPNDPYLTTWRDPSLTTLTVAWTTPLLTRPASGLPPEAAVNMVYNVFAFPVGSTGQAQLNTVCGMMDAMWSNPAGAIYTFGVSGNMVTLTGLNPTIPYLVTVDAHCRAGTCMLYQQQGQHVPFPASQNDPIPPQASPSPSPAPNGPASGSTTPSVAGPAAGGVIGALAVMGLGFFAYKRFSSGGGSSNAYVRSGGASSSGGFLASLGLGGGGSSAGRYAYVASADYADDGLGGGGGGGYVAPGASGDGGGASYSAL